MKLFSEYFNIVFQRIESQFVFKLRMPMNHESKSMELERYLKDWWMVLRAVYLYTSIVLSMCEHRMNQIQAS